jgi:hypothetical protein
MFLFLNKFLTPENHEELKILMLNNNTHDKTGPKILYCTATECWIIHLNGT